MAHERVSSVGLVILESVYPLLAFTATELSSK